MTGEIVPPRAASSAGITEHARGLVGYVDAVNVTDNPTASAHMTPVAGVRFVHEAGIEPTLQITSRDRNRLGLTADLLGSMDCVVVLVDHSVFDYALVASASPLILDCRNALKNYTGPHILRL